MKQHGQRNVYTIVGGKVYGNFDPAFRADMERLASAEGLTFDQYMARSLRRSLDAVAAMVA
jgi:hypothetical protein